MSPGDVPSENSPPRRPGPRPRSTPNCVPHSRLWAAPARATDLSGLPPAYIDVGSAETFRDEGVAYANAIWRPVGDTQLHV